MYTHLHSLCVEEGTISTLSNRTYIQIWKHNTKTPKMYNKNACIISENICSWEREREPDRAKPTQQHYNFQKMHRIYELTHFFSSLVTVCMRAVLCAECCVALCFEFVLKCLPYTLYVDVVGRVVIVVVFFMHTYTNATAHMYVYVWKETHAYRQWFIIFFISSYFVRWYDFFSRQICFQNEFNLLCAFVIHALI